MLCPLASKRPQTVCSDEAQSIIGDLDSILKVVIAIEEEAVSLQECSRKRKWDQLTISTVPETQFRRDVKRVRMILSGLAVRHC